MSEQAERAADRILDMILASLFNLPIEWGEYDGISTDDIAKVIDEEFQESKE